jgi:5-methyltetrahydrofolate--homocysteine methyltransferase
VKGDVHDIGKNIVGVVLACNGYQIIDLGVMVPANKILDEAQRLNVDIIGLSGLITPSLDEMVNIAVEMKKRNLQIPLLIGGATTSRIHTAVKIAEHYEHGVVHVLDASRSVTVVSDLMNENKSTFLQSIQNEYNQLRTDFWNKKNKTERHPLNESRKQALVLNEAQIVAAPQQAGPHIWNNYSLEAIRPYIDWTPFFITWELHGKYPAILSDAVVGEQATNLFNDANKLLDQLIAENWLSAHAVADVFKAQRQGTDDVYLPEQNTTLHFLRQQSIKAEGGTNLCLADFISAQHPDHLGAFAVTIKGIEPHLKRFDEQHDDYNKIMLQALADRLAEAFTELVHQKIRTEHWGYTTDDGLNMDDIIREKYQGIRPAPGYPACPDHTEKHKLFALLSVSENIGITLTESLAMYPASSVCGWYFAHPQSKYFGIGKIEPDQLADYAQRKNMPLDEAEKWLRPVLA